jgi:hypothetical protein
MPSPLWLLPLGLGASSVWPLLAAARRVRQELDGLRRSIGELRDLSAGVVVVAGGSAAVRRSIENTPRS